MNEQLRKETEKLVRSWMQHDRTKLRDYLVAGVEDPRINLQSILTRHFLVRHLMGEQFRALMEAEYRFGAVMDWLLRLAGRANDAEELAEVLYALEHGADNAEGTEIPGYVLRTFASLPADADPVRIPNYIRTFLLEKPRAEGQVQLEPNSLDTFRELWRQQLAALARAPDAEGLPSVLEPACGSANDYRFLAAYGLTRFINYTGLDLCPKNIENARALCPGARFETGNAFQVGWPDKAFEFCFVHDLLEHLSPEGLQVAIKEICRVTGLGICIGFFNMDEIENHMVQPLDEYHWNTLSMSRIKAAFADEGFTAQVIHIGSFLRQKTGCAETYNPNAYTFILRNPALP